MHIKDLIFDKDTGILVGFTSFSDTNEHLLKVCGRNCFRYLLPLYIIIIMIIVPIPMTTVSLLTV